MVQLNLVPVFGAKKNTSTIWRKFFSEISVQMVSAHGLVENGENRKLPLLSRRLIYIFIRRF